MPRRTALLEEQPPLWDEPEPATTPTSNATSKPAPKTVPKRLRNHVLGLARPWPKHLPCAMTCTTCGQIEGEGVCPDGCAVICGRPTPLDKKDGKAPVEVCLITLTLPARRLGPHDAVTCPHCDAVHGHPPKPGRAYRIGSCGQPYIVHTTTTERTIR